MSHRLHAALVAAAVLAGQGCLGATAQERRSKGSRVLLAGIGVTAVAVGTAAYYQGDRCPEGPGFSPGDCFLPHLGALGLGTAGVALTTTGLFNLGASIETGAAEPPPPPARTEGTDHVACAVWRDAYDREREPVRRDALLASRPGHCAASSP